MLIGTRELRLESGSNSKIVSIRLYAPEKQKVDWSCRYEIDWPDQARKSVAFGVDAMEAIYIALQKIGSEIYATSYHTSGNLAWNGPGNGYGFPVPKNIRHVLIGDDMRFDG